SSSTLNDPPKGNFPESPGRGPPAAPPKEESNLRKNTESGVFMGTTKRMPEFNLTDKVVLVSGAARGLGLTQAEALLEAGATVYALDRLPEPSPDFYRVQKRAAEELGTTFYYRRIDVRNVEALHKIVEDIGETHGRMDGLIAAAGIQQETPALEYSAKDANMMFEINITGVFMTAQAVAKQMIKFGNGGSIAMIASMSATIANRGLICPAYNASKAGVVQLARNLASEWGKYGIRVNTISPGYIVTQMVEELFEQHPERRRDWSTENMLGRLSKPREYRGAAVFLISDASSFMTGGDLRMDGGHASWLRLGSIAPNFQAETTNGPIDFHEFIGDKWVVLFSHPEDYTPVCTTELGAFAKVEPEFTKRGVKLIGLSANTIESHGGWIKDINELSNTNLRFPIIGDKQRKVAYLYDMLDHQDTTNVDQKGIAFTIRSVFIIDPKKTIRLILSYPASTGRNTAEVLRVVDSLQTGDMHKITTPINWVPGDDVIVHPSIKNEQAKEMFPNFKIVKPYLRFTPLPKEKTSAAV
ncbi:hypothetical protein MMC08_006197, partial [Hypocenomyce scalaris]|nr:hypothetical protein [Hypocenomyce scalaris]